jgi:hypothetical protein
VQGASSIGDSDFGVYLAPANSDNARSPYPLFPRPFPQTWFQRYEKPQAIESDHEEGAYLYFDYAQWHPVCGP